MANQLYIPASDSATCLNGLIAVFINKWSGSRTGQLFVENPIASDIPLFHINKNNSDVVVKNVSLTSLPYMTLPEQDDLSSLIVSGLASVCRHVIKHCENEDAIKALGFRSNCLQAPAEVSIWTSFCEVQMPESVKQFLTSPVGDVVTIPATLTQFEAHLKQPIRMHNVVKRFQQEPKPSPIVYEAKEVQKLAPTLLTHKYAEGPDMTLADLLLYPCVRILSDCLSSVGVELDAYLPLVSGWLATMEPTVSQTWAAVVQKPYIDDMSIHFGALRIQSPVVKLPPAKEASLYKKDPGRQGVGPLSAEDVVAVVETLKKQKLWLGDKDVHLPPELMVDVSEATDFVPRIDWTRLPDPAHPQQGQVPGSRLERKIQQLDNMIAAVMDSVADGDVIVDFCSGGGHLGIVLAHVLPQCSVIMIDNKEESVRQARLRVAQLKLSNVTLIQSNLDYFKAPFNLGVALHACGVATDLVLHMCLSNRASFVLCPCCYGNLALELPIEYPQSRLYKERCVLAKEFANLSRMADHVTPTGRLSMAAVDLDRISRASEEGYRVTLKKLKPDSSTPKHDLLIGII